MNITAQIRVSVDIGCHQHSVAIGLPGGDVLEEFDILHRPEGFKDFFDRIDGIAKPSRRPDGLLRSPAWQ